MRKIISILVLIAVLFSAAALSEKSDVSKDPFLFHTFSEAVNGSDGFNIRYTAFVISDGYAAALIEKDGRFFRTIVFLDEHAKELYDAYRNAEIPEAEDAQLEEWLLFYAYVETLPVHRTEELTVVPFGQEELDAMVGKTIEDIMSEPWKMGMRNYPADAEAGKDVIFPMVKGFCEYELVINEPFEVYLERRANDPYDPVTTLSLEYYSDLTVRSIRYTDISDNAIDLQYLANGTWINVTEMNSEIYDLMAEVSDILSASWKNTDPDQETREAMIAKLAEEYPGAEDIIRQIVESFP